MSPETFALALVQAAAFLVVGWVVGHRMLEHLGAGVISGPDRIGAPERILFALVGGVAFAVALMVANIVTRGAVFGVAFFVPLAWVLVVVSGRKAFARPRNLPWIPLVLCAGVLVAIYLTPVLAGGSGVRTGDSPWHLGWSQQLLAGEPVPTGPAPAYGRNAYPWGWHALQATLVRLVPGSDPLVAYEALHLLLLLGIPLAGASLARRLDAAAGWAGAVAISAVGGFGWITAGQAAFETTPASARFGADLVVASPNAVYGLFPPALPRELGVVLLAACCTLLVFAARGEGRSFAFGAGAVAGLLGLVSVPLFVSALVWFLAAVFVSRKGVKLKLSWLFVPASLIFLLWLGPVVTDFIRFGGFVDITPELGREWSLPVAFWSWGLLLPAAAAGTVIVFRRPHARPLVACLLGTLLLLALSIARATLDWQLAGNATLLHQGRVWPVAHLLAAAFGGACVTQLFRSTRSYRTIMSGALAPLLLVAAVASPALASMQLTRLMVGQRDGFVYGSEDYAPGSFVRNAAEVLGPDVTVRVEGSDRLAFTLFQLSGVRLAAYDDPRLERNDLRIRYRTLARRWDAETAVGGFEPDYLVVPDPGPGVGDVILSGSFDNQVWSLVALGPPGE